MIRMQRTKVLNIRLNKSITTMLFTIFFISATELTKFFILSLCHQPLKRICKMNDIDKGWMSPFDVNLELVVRRSMELHDFHKSTQAKFTFSVDWFTIVEKESLLVILEEVLVQC